MLGDTNKSSIWNYGGKVRLHLRPKPRHNRLRTKPILSINSSELRAMLEELTRYDLYRYRINICNRWNFCWLCRLPLFVAT